MALSEIYVDPSIAADSGTGTIGDPFGDLEYAIEQTTFDTTNGTRVNIKAGTAEVLAANLATAMADTVTTVAWAPTSAAPCVFQGYTAVAGDGGIGEISGGGSVPIIENATQSDVHLKDLKLGNVGANHVIRLDNFCSLVRCEIHTNTGSGLNAVLMDNYNEIMECYFHDCEDPAGNVINTNTICVIAYNYFINNDVTSGTIVDADGSRVENNIIVITEADNSGIVALNNGSIRNNSIYNSTGAGTGAGIKTNDTTHQGVIEGNLVEGFAGAGGVGIEYTNDVVFHSRGNSVYNCTTAYSTGSGAELLIDEDNETLTASPFTDAANGDFDPVDTGNVREGSLPNVIGGGFV